MEIIASQGLDWSDLNQKAEELRAFLEALNEKKIGDGRMAYNTQAAILEPRSEWFKGSRLVQYVATIGCETATFEHTRDAFTLLVEKVQAIYDQVIKCHSQDTHESKEALDFWYKLVDLENLIAGVSEPGVVQLCRNYRALGKVSEATALRNMADNAFTNIMRLQMHLFKTLSEIYPRLKDDSDIKRFYINSQKLLLNYPQFRSNLRGVRWNKDQGLVIPEALIRDCSSQIHSREECSSDSLQVAARHIKIPQQAEKIPGLQRGSFWEPHRFVTKNGKLVVERGVIGSCEGLDGLNNVYFRGDDDPRKKSMMVTCGGIDTDSKATALKKVLEESSDQNWIIHFLNPFSIKAGSFDKTQTRIMQKLPSTILQMGRCFNCLSSDKTEVGLFKEINCSNLIKIASMICKEARNFKDQFETLKTLEEKVDNVQRYQGRVEELKTETNKTLVINYHINISNLEKELPLMLSALTNAVEELKKQIKPPADLRRVLLLLQLFADIIQNQFNSNKDLSATAEIERYLMLYRMLNLNQVFICENGLDSSGPVRALADAQYFFEELIFKACRENRVGDEKLAEDTIEAKEEVYRLLKKIDQLKPTLYVRSMEIINEMRFPIVKDLNDVQTQTQAKEAQQALFDEDRVLKDENDKRIPVNLRNVILEELKKKVSPEECSDIYRIQLYLEMVFGALILDQEKTFNDSGAFGFQFHYDQTNWFWKKPKNPHPIERWPLFVLTDKNVPIQILEYNALSMLGSLFYDTITLTQAGIDLTHRVNQLRDK